MKKEFKATIAVILAVWIFAMGWVLGNNHGFKKGADEANKLINATQQTDTAPTTGTPSTEAPSTEAPTTEAPSTDAPSTQPQPSGAITVPSSKEDNTTTEKPAASNDPSSLSQDEVIEKMNSYVAQLRAEQNFTAHKVESIKIEVTDCSVPAAVGAINRIISGLAGDEELTFKFANGVTNDNDKSNATPKDVIPPTGKDFQLSKDGITSASARKDGENTVYTANIAVEDTTVSSPVPQYNSAVIGYLDLTSLNLTGVTISEANMHYPGSLVEIVVNPQGKVIKLVNKMPMTGKGVAKIIGMEGMATFEGGLDESWDFTY